MSTVVIGLEVPLFHKPFTYTFFLEFIDWDFQSVFRECALSRELLKRFQLQELRKVQQIQNTHT